MKLLFLDIDGVLNDHSKAVECYCGIQPQCARHLNRVITATDCKIVLTSAWRYMIHGGSMTKAGFEYMLLTHGIPAKGRIVGLTREDANLSDKHERGKQISDWLRGKDVEAYIVVDDDGEIGIPEAGHPFVQTNGKVGLTSDDADKLIAVLGRA